MTDMDEIRKLFDDLDRAYYAERCDSYQAARSALLQRVEALRDERDAKELEAAKADSWRQAAEAYRRERDRAREVAQHYSDAQDRADERRAAAEAERDAALAAQNRAPSPPETPARPEDPEDDPREREYVIVQTTVETLAHGEVPTCECGNDAVCVGVTEGRLETLAVMCDECCGHGNEDGWCVPLEKFYPSKRRRAPSHEVKKP